MSNDNEKPNTSPQLPEDGSAVSDTEAQNEVKSESAAVSDTSKVPEYKGMLPDEYTADELESLIEAEKLDDIAEYYSGKTDDNDIKDETIAEGGIMSESGDENIHDSSNGLSDRAKKILSYCISGAVSLAVIAAAFVCALNMPKDEEVLNAAADALRAEDDYISLKNEYESVAAEAAALEESAAEKKELSEGLVDFENTRAALRSQISSLQSELVTVNDENTALQQQVNDLDAQIQNRVGSSITLSAGRYTAGEQIAPGRYSVTGTGNLVVASSEGESKVNEQIESGVEVTLEDGDRISLNSTTKFTPLN